MCWTRSKREGIRPLIWKRPKKRLYLKKDYLFMNTYTKTIVVVKGAFLGVVLSLMAFWIVPVQVQAQAPP
jgi:hypothetical protein